MDVCSSLMSRSYASSHDMNRLDERLAFAPYMMHICNNIFTGNTKPLDLKTVQEAIKHAEECVRFNKFSGKERS